MNWGAVLGQFMTSENADEMLMIQEVFFCSVWVEAASRVSWGGGVNDRGHWVCFPLPGVPLLLFIALFSLFRVRTQETTRYLLSVLVFPRGSSLARGGSSLAGGGSSKAAGFHVPRLRETLCFQEGFFFRFWAAGL